LNRDDVGAIAIGDLGSPGGHTARHLRLLPVLVKGPGKLFETTAAFDSGCSRTLIDEQLARKMGLKGKITETRLEGIHGAKTEVMAIVSFELAGPASDFFEIPAAKTKKDLRFTRTESAMERMGKVTATLCPSGIEQCQI